MQFARSMLRQMLHACVDFALAESTALTQRIQDDIFYSAERSLRTDEQNLLWTSFQGLNKRARDFNRILQQQLPGMLQKSLDSDSIAALSDVEANQKLKLVDVEDVEREVLITNNIRLLEDLCSETLAGLTHRVCLLKGHSSPSIYYNPFRPEAFVRGFVAAWEEFDGNRLSTRAVLRALRMQNFLPLNALYTDLNTMLIDKGVIPQSGFMIKRESPTPGSRGGAGSGGGAGSQDKELWNRSPEGGHRPVDTSATQQINLANMAMLAGLPLGASTSGLANVPPNWQFNPARFMQQLGVLLEQFGRLSPGGGVIARAEVLSGGASPMVAAPDSALLRRLEALQAQPWRGAAPGGAAVTGEVEQVPGIPGEPGVSAEGFIDGFTVGANYGTIDSENAEPAALPGAWLLEQIGAGEEAQQASEIDRATIEMLARIFDFVLQDRAIPAEIKALIAQLQVPVLKAALIDREFFLREEHPARRLVDMMARAGVHWNREAGPEDPLFKGFENAVERAHTFGDDLTLFDDIVNDFQETLEAQESRTEEEVADKIEKAAHDEATAFAVEEVEKRVARRFELADIGATLGRFLDEHWRRVLIRRCVERDDEPELWSQSLEAMDVLIWSVLPKINSIERGELLKSLPGLLRHINESLDMVEWSGPDRDRFMKYLMDTHATVVRTAVPQVAPGSVPMSTPRLAQDSTVDEVAAKPKSGMTQFGVERGDWFVLEMGEETSLRYRLSWVSPMRTKYIFTSREGERAIVKNDLELTDMLKSGALRKLDTSPVVQRAIAATLLAPSISAVPVTA
ncbi:hypothetical protein BH09PSE6_BH09PSE6_27920 [soil metagenome]